MLSKGRTLKNGGRKSIYLTIQKFVGTTTPQDKIGSIDLLELLAIEKTFGRLPLQGRVLAEAIFDRLCYLMHTW